MTPMAGTLDGGPSDCRATRLDRSAQSATLYGVVSFRGGPFKKSKRLFNEQLSAVGGWLTGSEEAQAC